MCQVKFSVRNLWDEITGQFQFTRQVTKLDQYSFYTPLLVYGVCVRPRQSDDSTRSTQGLEVETHNNI